MVSSGLLHLNFQFLSSFLKFTTARKSTYNVSHLDNLVPHASSQKHLDLSNRTVQISLTLKNHIEKTTKKIAKLNKHSSATLDVILGLVGWCLQHLVGSLASFEAVPNAVESDTNDLKVIKMSFVTVVTIVNVLTSDQITKQRQYFVIFSCTSTYSRLIFYRSSF